MKSPLIFSALLFFRFLAGAQPICLHPLNPHYFLYRGKPTVLLTSAEHYGAVINGSTDYKKYLDILQRDHFNLTRIFTGSYVEGNYYEGAGKRLKWKEDQNTLSVRPGKLLAPWARSVIPGYINRGNKFDLDRWDNRYFARIKDFCREASARGIIVEIVFFSANYGPANWRNSPLNRHNNINLKREVPYNEIYFSSNQELIRYQLGMVRKLVEELNEFDNVYYEICNEPYWLKGIPEVDSSIHAQQVTPEIYAWQKNIASAVKEVEKRLPKKQLIAQNFANNYLKIENPDSAVSILNFHYAYPPKTVTDNYSLNKPVSFDETFEGLNASARRREAWCFMLEGGAVYNNLDWSFANDDMTGMGLNSYGRRQSGQKVRHQLEILQQNLRDFNFVKAKPLDSTYKRGLTDGINLYGLGINGEDYMFYWIKTKEVSLPDWDCPLPAGKYMIKWMDPATGRIIGKGAIQNWSKVLTLKIPYFDDDLVLRIIHLR